jgi:hypothetical protein
MTTRDERRDNVLQTVMVHTAAEQAAMTVDDPHQLATTLAAAMATQPAHSLFVRSAVLAGRLAEGLALITGVTVHDVLRAMLEAHSDDDGWTLRMFDIASAVLETDRLQTQQPPTREG